MAESQIHRALSRQGQPAHASILLSPPSNVFVGLWRSSSSFFVCLSRNRHGPSDHLNFHICLAALLARFPLPILLSNVPFSNLVTFKIHEVSTWMAVAVLGYMAVVLLASEVVGPLLAASNTVGCCFHKRSDGERSGDMKLPVEVDTIAGCMWYVCDSRMLEDFGGASSTNTSRSLVGYGWRTRKGKTKKEKASGRLPVCESETTDIGAQRRYMLREIVGVYSGVGRVAVDYQ